MLLDAASGDDASVDTISHADIKGDFKVRSLNQVNMHKSSEKIKTAKSN
ncbi:hypothetical protein H6F50_22940 [Coleofasciculus sp. FACHB-712]|nr:hypothetical protein [Coleofasciculus sp. FACHB-712]